MNSCKLPSLQLSVFLMLMTPHAFATEADQKYQFHASPNCVLQKRVNRDWEKADPQEIEPTEAFSLHETYQHPELSTFYANHGVYSALTPCFSAVTKEEIKKEEEIEEENESEFLHQARHHILEITPSFGYGSSTANYKNISIDSANTSGVITGAVLEYGLTEHISVGANLVYGALSTTTTPAGANSMIASGLEDPQFFLSGKNDFGNSEVRFNLLFVMPLSHETTHGNGNDTTAKAGFVFTPALGYEYHQNHNIYGAQIAYDLVKSDARNTTVDQTETATTTHASGGKEIVGSLFFEHRFHAGEYGISFQYGNVAHTSENGLAFDNSGTIWTATLYGEIEFNEKVSLLPAIVFSRANFEADLDNADVASIKSFSGSLGARFKF